MAAASSPSRNSILSPIESLAGPSILSGIAHHPVPDNMRQGCLDHLLGIVCLLTRHVPKRRVESVRYRCGSTGDVVELVELLCLVVHGFHPCVKACIGFDWFRRHVASSVKTITSRRCWTIKLSSIQAWPMSPQAVPQLFRIRKRRSVYMVAIPTATTACNPRTGPVGEMTHGDVGA